MRDYGKVHSTFWSSPTTSSMTDDGKILALYLMTCSHNTIAGVFRLPDGYVSEDLGWTLERVGKGFAELLSKGFANRCGTTKWVWIAKHLEWNKPENPNQRKSAAKIAQCVPSECCWKLDFMRVCGPSLGLEPPPNPNPCGTVGKPFLNQEQEQEQKQDIEEAKASLSTSSPAKPMDELFADEGKVKAAGVPNCPIDALLDAYEELLPMLPAPRRSLFKTGKRAAPMRQRWTWVLTQTHERGPRSGQRLATTATEGLEWFRKYFEHVAKSDFLTGRDGKWTGCNIGFLMQLDKFSKVLEGAYHKAEVTHA